MARYILDDLGVYVAAREEHAQAGTLGRAADLLADAQMDAVADDAAIGFSHTSGN